MEYLLLTGSRSSQKCESDFYSKGDCKTDGFDMVGALVEFGWSGTADVFFAPAIGAIRTGLHGSGCSVDARGSRSYRLSLLRVVWAGVKMMRRHRCTTK